MHRPGFWLVAGFITLTLFAAGVLWTSKQQTVPFTATSHLRVLKVSLGTNHSYSTDPLWKRQLRKVLPTSLATRLGSVDEFYATTPYPTLVVWLEERDLHGRRIAPRFDVPSVLMKDGHSARTKNNIVQLTFASFARDEKEIPIVLTDRTNIFRFTVRNPKPVARAHWTATSLPQTQTVDVTRVTFSQPRRFGAPSEFLAGIRARGEDPAGWMTWRITTFDDLGNWASFRNGAFSSSPVPLPLVPRTNSVWRLQVEGTEYISAGFVDPPSTGRAVELPVKARAQAHGIRSIVFAGAGEHMITNGITASSRPFNGAHIRVRDFTITAGGEWSLYIETPIPLLLGVIERGANFPKLRVRERLSRDDGRVFVATVVTNLLRTIGQREFVATVYDPRVTPFASNLEVEIVCALPATDFFISPP